MPVTTRDIHDEADRLTLRRQLAENAISLVNPNPQTLARLDRIGAIEWFPPGETDDEGRELLDYAVDWDGIR